MKSTLINESGLYTAIIGSKLPQAKSFRRWITSDVLPSIRKHGAYMTTETIEKTLADPDFIIGLATELKKEREENARLKPKAEVYDTLMNTEGLLNMKEVSDCFGIGRTKFFKILRDNGVLSSKESNWNLPIGNYRRYFKPKITLFKTSEGMKYICTPLLKVKSTKFVHKLLKENNLLKEVN